MLAGLTRMVRFSSRSGDWPTAEDDLDLLGPGQGHWGVDAKGTVVIGAGAEVRGSIAASGLVVWGVVAGDLKIGGHVEVVPGGAIAGTVAARSLRVSEGASLKARVII